LTKSSEGTEKETPIRRRSLFPYTSSAAFVMLTRAQSHCETPKWTPRSRPLKHARSPMVQLCKEEQCRQRTHSTGVDVGGITQARWRARVERTTQSNDGQGMMGQRRSSDLAQDVELLRLLPSKWARAAVLKALIEWWSNAHTRVAWDLAYPRSSTPFFIKQCPNMLRKGMFSHSMRLSRERATSRA
jgi:hypothetical protein